MPHPSVQKGKFLAALVAFGAAVALAGPARADVLEVGQGGARWISGGPAVAESAPSLLAVPIASAAASSDIPPRWRDTVARLSARYDLSPAIIAALVRQESGWHEGARSAKGARGLAQLMPATARSLGADPDDAEANISAGARYLRLLIDHFDGDIEKALAAYNAGPGRVTAAGGVPRIAETRAYVAAILANLASQSRRN